MNGVNQDTSTLNTTDKVSEWTSTSSDNNSDVVNILSLPKEVIEFVEKKQKWFFEKGEIAKAQQLWELLWTGLVLSNKTKQEMVNKAISDLSNPYRSVEGTLNFIAALGIDITKDDQLLRRALNLVFYHSQNNGMSDFMGRLHYNQINIALSIDAKDAQKLVTFAPKNGPREVLPKDWTITIDIGWWGTGRGWYLVEGDTSAKRIIDINKKYANT